MNLPSLFFFLNIVLALRDLLHFGTHFRFGSSMSRTQPAEILVMTALYLQMNLGRVNTLIILTLAAPENDIAPHLFRFFISSSMVSQLLFGLFVCALYVLCYYK